MNFNFFLSTASFPTVFQYELILEKSILDMLRQATRNLSLRFPSNGDHLKALLLCLYSDIHSIYPVNLNHLSGAYSLGKGPLRSLHNHYRWFLESVKKACCPDIAYYFFMLYTLEHSKSRLTYMHVPPLPSDWTIACEAIP